MSIEYLNNILWCPIDIPKFPVFKESIEANAEWIAWKFKRITEKRNTAYDVTDFTKEVQDSMPELVSWINNFPYKTIRNIKINYQIDTVPLHIDFTRPDDEPDLYKNNIENEPCGYRVLIQGKRSNALYIEHNGSKLYTTLPDETDTYVLGHTLMPHGVDYEPGRNTMFMHFEIDKEKHHELLFRSYEKYKQYAILSSNK